MTHTFCLFVNIEKFRLKQSKLSKYYHEFQVALPRVFNTVYKENNRNTTVEVNVVI
jgi:hypothetical protein